MAMVLGIIAMVSFFAAIAQAFKLAGEADVRIGAAGFLSLIFSLVGLVLAVLGLGEREIFRAIPIAAAIVCAIDVIAWIGILLLGIGII